MFKRYSFKYFFAEKLTEEIVSHFFESLGVFKFKILGELRHMQKILFIRALAREIF